jgi:hypothetical protein
MKFDIDYRAKCMDLQNIKNQIRKYIDEDKMFFVDNIKYNEENDIFINDSLLSKFQHITKEQLCSMYNINDMILCSSHIKKDVYKEVFYNMKKYYIT